MNQEVHVAAKHSLNIANLRTAIDQAAKSGGWVVVVYPDAETGARARRVLPAMLPEGSSAGGRTALMPGGGKLSVVSAEDEVFDPGTPVTAMFFGWDVATDRQYRGMAAWRSRASVIIGVSDGAGGA